MVIQIEADANEQELADASEAIADLLERADEVELPPAAIRLLVALDEALSRGRA
jgi:hypothetical protein